MDTVIAPPAPATTALTPPASGEYWPGQGGLYIATALASHGLPLRALVASVDEAEDLIYGPHLDVPGATSQLDGRANTAAQWASDYTADGHTDFHLPSRHDLLMAYWHAPQLFNQDDWYASSTQYSRLYAFIQFFEHGSSYWGNKDYGRRVRAFRWVQLDHLST